MHSWNHVMFGSTSEFFFRHLAGIQQLPGTRGYTSLVFHPSVLLSSSTSGGLGGVCANLSWVNATMVRPHGNITANWACHASHDGIAYYEITTPVGVPQSRVHVPVAAHKGGTPGNPGSCGACDRATAKVVMTQPHACTCTTSTTSAFGLCVHAVAEVA